MPQNPIERALAGVVAGDHIVVDNLVMVPLLGPSAKVVDYKTLDEAIGEGSSEVTEISAEGSVPDLRVINRSPRPTLIVDGEELVGAKQNRVVNLSILVAANSELTIPVSCVEAGRWHARSRGFSSAPRAHYASGRAKRVAQVSYSMASAGMRYADQSAVWADIHAKSASLSSRSDTAAMEQMYTDHASSIDRYVNGCAPVDGQVGALFAIGGRIVGFDLFDDAATCRKLLPKLVRSYAVDAIDMRNIPSSAPNPEQGRGPALADATGFLSGIAAAPQQRVRAIGLGHDVRLSGDGLVGAGLILEDRVVHLNGFVQ